MTEIETKEVINKIFKEIFDKESSYSVEEIKNKFAFDVRLPIIVRDSITGEETYTVTVNSFKFITNSNMEKRDNNEGWILDKKPVNNLKELLEIWDSINYTTTERVYESMNVSKSDPIYNCSNVYNSTNSSKCSNIIFCDGVHESNYTIASQRSTNLNYCIRVDDSNTCTNSYNVICSAKISNSMFIQDCSNLFECIFCSHISNKEYCIANMEFTKEEYYYLKGQIIKWIMSS